MKTHRIWALTRVVLPLAIVVGALLATGSVGAQEPPIERGPGVAHAVSCLGGNGRVDTNIVNLGETAAVYRLTFEGLTAREITVAPFDWGRISITGRPDSSANNPGYTTIVQRDGVVLSTSELVVDCDSADPQVTEGEVHLVNACRTINGATNGYILVQIVNPTDMVTPYVIIWDDGAIPNRSTTAQPYGAGVRAVTGRPDGTYGMQVRVGSTVVYAADVTVACDSPVAAPTATPLPAATPTPTPTAAPPTPTPVPMPPMVSATIEIDCPNSALARVRATVTNSGAAAIEAALGVTDQVTDSGQARITTLNPGQSGVLIITAVPAGTYRITVGVDGLTVESRVVTLDCAATTEAVDDTYVVPADAATILDVLMNDVGNDLSVSDVTSPTLNGGTVDVVDNEVTYTPLAGYSGPDEFTYEVVNAFGPTDSATVTITVSAAPNPTDDVVTLTEDESASIDILANDGALPNDATLVVAIDPADTFITHDGNGLIEIENQPEWNSLVAGESLGFTVDYSITDESGRSASATVTFTVNGVTDGPAVLSAAVTQECAGTNGVVNVTISATGGDQPAEYEVFGDTAEEPVTGMLASGSTVVTFDLQPDGEFFAEAFDVTAGNFIAEEELTIECNFVDGFDSVTTTCIFDPGAKANDTQVVLTWTYTGTEGVDPAQAGLLVFEVAGLVVATEVSVSSGSVSFDQFMVPGILSFTPEITATLFDAASTTLDENGEIVEGPVPDVIDSVTITGCAS